VNIFSQSAFGWILETEVLRIRTRCTRHPTNVPSEHSGNMMVNGEQRICSDTVQSRIQGEESDSSRSDPQREGSLQATLLSTKLAA
jgi:hypothetical protein